MWLFLSWRWSVDVSRERRRYRLDAQVSLLPFLAQHRSALPMPSIRAHNDHIHRPTLLRLIRLIFFRTSPTDRNSISPLAPGPMPPATTAPIHSAPGPIPSPSSSSPSASSNIQAISSVIVPGRSRIRIGRSRHCRYRSHPRYRRCCRAF